MRTLSELGLAVEREWYRHQNDHERFAEVAERALIEASLADHVSLPAVADWLARAVDVPRQQDLRGEFSDVALTAFANSEFSVDLLHWLDASTAVHDHAFSGAFTVAEGSSLHARYRFTSRERICDRAFVGDLEMVDVEYLQRGDVRRIEPHDKLIHAVFHLDRPTLSVVVRTEKHSTAAPQLVYFRPSLALDTQFERPRTVKQRQYAQMLARIGGDLHIQYLRTLLDECDFRTAFLVVTDLHGLVDDACLAELVAGARSRHGARVDLLTAAVAEQKRTDLLMKWRASVHEPELRFFLALLLNVPTREQIHRLIRARWPERDPVDRILDWTRRLCQGDSDGEWLDRPSMIVLRGMFENLAFEKIVARMSEAYPSAAIGGDTAAVFDRLQALRNSVFLQPLFR